MRTIKQKCKFCLKEFNAYIHNVKKGFGKHCSKRCSNKANNLGFKQGHKGHLTPETYKANGLKISKAKKGIKFSEDHKKALAKARIELYKRIGHKKCKARQRKCYKCVEWRKAVFKRDNYTCQICGVRGVYLEADHIKSWAKFPKLRHILSNGRTLCKPCHIKTPNYKSKAKIWGK